MLTLIEFIGLQFSLIQNLVNSAPSVNLSAPPYFLRGAQLTFFCVVASSAALCILFNDGDQSHHVSGMQLDVS